VRCAFDPPYYASYDRRVQARLDHCVIAVSDWERSNSFYRDVLGAELVARGQGWAYRFGEQQLNVHGPGVSAGPVARIPVQPGNSDLCFVWDGPISDAAVHLGERGVPSRKDPSSATAQVARARASTSAIQTGRCWSSSPTNKTPRARISPERARRWHVTKPLLCATSSGRRVGRLSAATGPGPTAFGQGTRLLGHPSRVVEVAPQQHLYVGVEAAELVGGPAGEGVVD
jgi:catechol 2,3-dioxygenase-like lactoylglutathione lyase family enzyme